MYVQTPALFPQPPTAAAFKDPPQPARPGQRGAGGAPIRPTSAAAATRWRQHRRHHHHRPSVGDSGSGEGRERAGAGGGGRSGIRAATAPCPPPSRPPLPLSPQSTVCQPTPPGTRSAARRPHASAPTHPATPFDRGATTKRTQQKKRPATATPVHAQRRSRPQTRQQPRGNDGGGRRRQWRQRGGRRPPAGHTAAGTRGGGRLGGGGRSRSARAGRGSQSPPQRPVGGGGGPSWRPPAVQQGKEQEVGLLATRAHQRQRQEPPWRGPGAPAAEVPSPPILSRGARLPGCTPPPPPHAIPTQQTPRPRRQAAAASTRGGEGGWGGRRKGKRQGGAAGHWPVWVQRPSPMGVAARGRNSVARRRRGVQSERGGHGGGGGEPSAGTRVGRQRSRTLPVHLTPSRGASREQRMPLWRGCLVCTAWPPPLAGVSRMHRMPPTDSVHR